MNDSFGISPSSSELPPREVPSPDEVPQFGAIDIVEAFTAMRHEWRGQTKESRALVEQVQAAVATMESLNAKWRARAEEGGQRDAGDARPLVHVLVETDHQLSRAIAAAGHWESARQLRETRAAETAERFLANMSALGRWFARPLWNFLAHQRQSSDHSSLEPVIEGLQLVLARLRRAMSDHQIERLDTVGRPFDAGTMHAIGTVPSTAYPAGHVAEQLSPGYCWRGQMLRFAEVRVAADHVAATPEVN
ncbi:MAG: nucleotide exchange factor GrpE [Pirellulaceae bacterium]